MILKLMEYKPVIVKIPASKGMILILVINNAVTRPAKHPAKNDTIIPK
ncbi:MAG: hypothetical protein ACLUIS_02290 [Longibaculum sp.]